jgi:hypothetical protein
VLPPLLVHLLGLCIGESVTLVGELGEWIVVLIALLNTPIYDAIEARSGP